MSGIGELDRPETPRSPGAWDERSRTCLTDGGHGPGADLAIGDAGVAPSSGTSPPDEADDGGEGVRSGEHGPHGHHTANSEHND
ncbi:hypothetical protein ACFV1R_37895, partial [Streptomyces coelicoflavus]